MTRIGLFRISSALPLSLLLFAGAARAHEVRPAYLELKQVGPETYDLLWKVPARDEDRRLGLHLRLPEDCKHVAPPSATFVAGAWVERSRIARTGGLTGAEIEIEGLAATLTDALVRIERADGSTQVTRLTPDRTSFVVEAAPRASQVAATYLRLGVEHILTGADHLLYILAMLLLVRGWKRLVATITAFTATHSLTLTAAALGWVRVPQPPVEATIALSILLVASEIVRARQGRSGLTERWPWVVSFTFGLLHGFGFAGALHEVGLPPGAIPVALALFNVGVEIGQLLFIAGALALLAVGRRALERSRAGGATFLPAPAAWRTASAFGIGGVAALWFLQRTSSFLS